MAKKKKEKRETNIFGVENIFPSISTPIIELNMNMNMNMHSIILSSIVQPVTPFSSRTSSIRKLSSHHSPLVCKASYSITDFDLYDLLGVDSSSDHSAIKHAYRSLQKKCHPDIAGLAGHDMAIVLNEAYAVLSDPLSRFSYDKVSIQFN